MVSFGLTEFRAPQSVVRTVRGVVRAHPDVFISVLVVAALCGGGEMTAEEIARSIEACKVHPFPNGWMCILPVLYEMQSRAVITARWAHEGGVTRKKYRLP